MKIYIAAFCALLIVFSSINAEAKSKCPLKKIPFGASAEKIVQEYRLSPPELAENTPYFTIDIFGNEFCKAMPEATQMTFEFISGQLVRIEMRLTGETGKLRAIAEDTFGEIKKKNNAGHKDSGNLQYNWQEGKLLALYSSRDSNGELEEYFELSSKGFEDITAKLNSVKENSDAVQ